MFSRFPFLLTILFAFAFSSAGAHPIPDISVCGSFTSEGSATIYVEVDPRCVASDPPTAPYLTEEIFQTLSAPRQAEIRAQVAALLQKSLEFFLEPIGRIQPEFAFDFTQPTRVPLSKDAPRVVLTGHWSTTIPAGVTGWKIRALPTAPLAVVFTNLLNNQPQTKFAVLFPNETSFTLDLTHLTTTIIPPSSIPASTPWHDRWQTFLSLFKQGFVHVIPKGFDHILFVLGLFLLSRNWRPLLLQVTVFTLAHSTTLALAATGHLKISSSIVEPIIALSIAAVAIENLFHSRPTTWRLTLVFFFGLIHGLGFASALQELQLPSASLATGLLGFNLGVEAAQITVIAAAFLVTFPIQNHLSYRRWIVVPGSLLIASAGLYWAVQRTFF
jgi:hypothetical protein